MLGSSRLDVLQVTAQNSSAHGGAGERRRKWFECRDQSSEKSTSWSSAGRAEGRQAWEIEHYESNVLWEWVRPSQAAISRPVTPWTELNLTVSFRLLVATLVSFQWLKTCHRCDSRGLILNKLQFQESRYVETYLGTIHLMIEWQYAYKWSIPFIERFN